MAADIFISFASKDVKVAMTLCSALETRGFACWISARDIEPGANFQVAIVQALRRARVMLLVFTANSNTSEEMTKELALASQQKIMVIPLRVEDVTPNDAFAYEFATRQWIDAFADWETSIDQLARRVGQALKPTGEVAQEAAPVAVEAPAPKPAPEPKAPPVAVAAPPPPKKAPVPEPVAEEEAVAPVSSGLLKRLATKPPRVEAEPASIVSKPEPKPERPTKAEPVAAKKVEPVAANESIEPETGAPEKKVAARIALPLAAAGFAIAVAAAAVSVMRSQPPEAPSSVAAAPVAPRLSTAVVTQPPVAPEEAAPAVVEEAPKLVKTNRPKRVQAETSSPETADIPF